MTDAADGDRARATLRTRHPRPDVVAAALSPDNTPQMTTDVVDDRVVTTVAREGVAGLRATVQDYLRNLDAADRTVRVALSSLEDTDADFADGTAPDERTHTDNPTNEDTKTTDNE